MKRITPLAFSLILALVATLGAFGTTSAAGCDGNRRGDIRAEANVWKNVPYTSSRRVLNFWTNSPGHSQRSYKVKIGKGVSLQIKGGGSLWTFPCQEGWNKGYANNPLPGRTITWLKQQGLARTRSN